MDAKIKNRFCSGIEPSTLCAENFFAPFLKKIIYLESGQLTYTENNNFLKFPRREYIVRIPGLKEVHFAVIAGNPSHIENPHGFYLRGFFSQILRT